MTQTKTIGILGGCSNIATGHMYATLNTLSNARLGGWQMVETLIAGMNFAVIENHLRRNEWEGLKPYLARHLDALAPADIVICGSNTLHKLVPDLMKGRDQTFIHIFDGPGAVALEQGCKTLALFGTSATMLDGYATAYFKDTFGIEIVVPDVASCQEIDRIIFDELVKSEVKDSSRQFYIDVYERLARDAGAQGLILGCTEIQMLIGAQDLKGALKLDTMHLLCAAAVEAALA